jgi:DNA-cytosine methyltransferase
MFRGYNKDFILTAGFPCQNASIAGNREGLAGSETGLFHELARIIRELKPEWFILENVPGLLSVNKGRDMAYIIQELSEIGYCVCWRILDARYFGVAQRRRRLWIVGSFGNTRSAEVLFKQESSRRNDKAKQEMGARRLCISTKDGERQDPTGETLIASTIGTNDNYRANARTKRNFIAKTIQAKQGDRFNADENLIACTLGTIDGANGTKGGGTNLVANTIGATQRGNTSFVWQDTYIAEIDADREGKIDGIS